MMKSAFRYARILGPRVSPLRAVPATLLTGLIVTAAVASCSNGPDKSRTIDNSDGGSSGGGQGGGGGSNGGDGGRGGASGSGDGGSGALIDTDSGTGATGGLDGGECGGIEETGTQEVLPVDIIFMIDNSQSMTEEIVEVQDRINQDFIKIIEDSKLDYRVIMISRYGDVNIAVGGSNHPVCVQAPLGADDCSTADTTPLVNTERFYHYSADIESTNAWCRALEGFSASDELADPPRPGWTPVAPDGWGAFLREKAIKTFVVISDDNSECSFGGNNFNDQNTVAGGETAAQQFDTALLALSPTQFGTAEKRKYKWFSIVGMTANTPGDEPWPATAPINTAICPEGVTPGTGHQALSIMTDALRYPSCGHDNFDKMFTAIAQSVVDGAGLSCEWVIPPPPLGEEFDPEKIGLCYKPAGSTECKKNPPIYFLDDASKCGPDGGFYFDDPVNPKKIIVCPTTCEMLEADMEGAITIVFGCKPDIPE